MSEKLTTLFSHQQVAAAIRRIAEEISKDYGDQPIHLVGVLRGAAPFTCSLAMQLTMLVALDFIRVESYFGTNSGEIKDIMGLSESLEGEHVIIVEDIIDSGQTMRYLVDQWQKTQRPKSLKVCTLLDKPLRRTTPIEPDYCGFEIPDTFVVGYGLDYNQRYRNLPYIAELLLPDAEV